MSDERVEDGPSPLTRGETQSILACAKQFQEERDAAVAERDRYRQALQESASEFCRAADTSPMRHPWCIEMAKLCS